MRDIPAHFVRPNEANRYPRRIVTLDSEARIRETRRGETHRFRCAAGSFDELPAGGGEPLRSQREVFATPEAVWEWVDGLTRARVRTVVFCHNTAYDIRITDGLRLLPMLGWLLEFLTVDGSRCVARYTRHKDGCGRRQTDQEGAAGRCDCGDRRSLTITDLYSFLPTSLEVIGDRLGIAKRPLPKQTDSEATWLARCIDDVTITRAAVLRLLQYLESNDMGSFRLTGAAQAMACFRHRHMDRYSLLAHRDAPVLETERRACWTGRCEAFRWGKIAGPIHEWDFELSYLRLAARTRLPVRLRGEIGPISVQRLRQLAGTRRVLCEIVAAQETPALPSSDGERIRWPTGEFATTVWDQEILAAVDRGATVTVKRAWVYDSRPALARWAQWLLSELAPDGLPADALERIMLKAWARSLIGRFGLRHPVWEKVGRVPGSTLELVPFHDMDSGEQGAHLTVGGDWFERTGLVEAPDSMPAMMGAIMAAARVQLLDALDWVGWDQVLYVDTDSLIVTAAGHRRLLEDGGPPGGGVLRHKGAYSHATIRGPRSLELGDTLRVAGLPRKAVRRTDGRYEAEIWEGLDRSLMRGQPGLVHVTKRIVTVAGQDSRRRHLPDGSTVPFVAVPA